MIDKQKGTGEGMLLYIEGAESADPAHRNIYFDIWILEDLSKMLKMCTQKLQSFAENRKGGG